MPNWALDPVRAPKNPIFNGPSGCAPAAGDVVVGALLGFLSLVHIVATSARAVATETARSRPVVPPDRNASPRPARHGRRRCELYATGSSTCPARRRGPDQPSPKQTKPAAAATCP